MYYIKKILTITTVSGIEMFSQ